MRRKIREYIWLAAGIICMVAAIHQTIILGIGQSWPFFAFGLVAFAFWWIRRNMRNSEDQ